MISKATLSLLLCSIATFLVGINIGFVYPAASSSDSSDPSLCPEVALSAQQSSSQQQQQPRICAADESLTTQRFPVQKDGKLQFQPAVQRFPYLQWQQRFGSALPPVHDAPGLYAYLFTHTDGVVDSIDAAVEQCSSIDVSYMPQDVTQCMMLSESNNDVTALHPLSTQLQAKTRRYEHTLRDGWRFRLRQPPSERHTNLTFAFMSAYLSEQKRFVERMTTAMAELAADKRLYVTLLHNTTLQTLRLIPTDAEKDLWLVFATEAASQPLMTEIVPANVRLFTDPMLEKLAAVAPGSLATDWFMKFVCLTVITNHPGGFTWVDPGTTISEAGLAFLNDRRTAPPPPPPPEGQEGGSGDGGQEAVASVAADRSKKGGVEKLGGFLAYTGDDERAVIFVPLLQPTSEASVTFSTRVIQVKGGVDPRFHRLVKDIFYACMQNFDVGLTWGSFDMLFSWRLLEQLSMSSKLGMSVLPPWIFP